jgi:hypothetical protein
MARPVENSNPVRALCAAVARNLGVPLRTVEASATAAELHVHVPVKSAHLEPVLLRKNITQALAVTAGHRLARCVVYSAEGDRVAVWKVPEPKP